MKKKLLLFFCMFFCLAFPKPAFAEEFESGGTGLQIMIVLDCSGSMRRNDPSRSAVHMVQAFVDSIHAEDLEIGYVAYNDGILSSSPPVPVVDTAQRQQLKDAVEKAVYVGDTDIGLGLSAAYERMSADRDGRKAIVLISDGETDLRDGAPRTVEESDADLNACVELCRREEIPVYTITFGAYDGNEEALKEIAEQTGGENYTAEVPEKLIDVLYGILGKDVAYRIQEFSNGIFAGGVQEIRCTLDEPYLDELDVLLISEREIGDTFLEYGGSEIVMTKLSNYAVGKIEKDQIDDTVRELTVYVTTTEKQNLRMFLVSYRKLSPVFRMETEVDKNELTPYWICFRDGDGNVIKDEAFYKRFQWKLECGGNEGPFLEGQDTLEMDDGILRGTVRADRSGSYGMTGILSDELGEYTFRVPVTVSNRPPSGVLPGITCKAYEKESSFDLRQYFEDADHDSLRFALTGGEQEAAELSLTEEGILRVIPVKAGVQSAVLTVSDGEDTCICPLQITVMSFWEMYGWLLILVLIVLSAAGYLVFRRLKQRQDTVSVSEPDLIAEEKRDVRFCGKLDAYFTMLPEHEEEIPPLSFPLYKVRDNKIIVGDLFQKYPKTVDSLELDGIFLIAEEERRMILYHQSEAEVMIGSTIVCRRLRYHVSFGDVIYITSQDGTYDLEIHYVAVHL